MRGGGRFHAALWQTATVTFERRQDLFLENETHSGNKHTGTGRKEMFYLMTHSTHFIYGYMASGIW